MWAYDRGFDRDALINNYTIKDIDENSNAYKSGLRNRDIVIKYDFPKWGSPDQRVTSNTIKGEFQFRPESANKKDIYIDTTTFKFSLRHDLILRGKIMTKNYTGPQINSGNVNYNNNDCKNFTKNI
ncbi:hypothetical protein [Rickettsia rickettsii]|uniref:Uncharacterized protein n=1 Tax=Rickettsia rickettsii (strain Sheila Smith) TaxID=392021 RepID=A0A0H3AUA2_RICRS|nr:hypothetical protein [Rickettsia rickettsii]ABV76052.1 hypothetical protein A1G_02525 [Rickettsia rickettsii str. 'Sheila Smith']AFB22374.1 hypothetical protein RPN_04395 [Rickettsia rickettsii str. Brazil]AFB23390.1 hypothetical protein RPL_02505 [Rickettsia rickettsii str. Colombia]AFB24743.1 hypothetical protein RPO_02515 [Rickettsia rickettsii str. Arizona]AFB27428.1 hypothetical protein RPJ_02495 [Rickettsia rickettsii str. Hino]